MFSNFDYDVIKHISIFVTLLIIISFFLKNKIYKYTLLTFIFFSFFYLPTPNLNQVFCINFNLLINYILFFASLIFIYTKI